MTGALRLLLLSLTVLALSAGCATTPDIEGDCPNFFTEEKEITKCKKRVLTRETKRFEAAQLEARKQACSDSGRVWYSDGRSGACYHRSQISQILGGGRTF